MNGDIWMTIFEWALIVGFVAIGGAIVFLLSVFLIASALYIFPAKQVKIDLKKIAENEIESRIYLDEYKYTIANQHWQDKIDAKVKAERDLNDKIRKKAAELKSITAAVERAPKTNKKKG